ncbi:MAG: hypothetical protein LM564_05925 [Desulfurococcaceae archaeon]|nr:hypothetical protein [Desulfurococcaceae archaeon]
MESPSASVTCAGDPPRVRLVAPGVESAQRTPSAVSCSGHSKGLLSVPGGFEVGLEEYGYEEALKR